MSPNCQQAGIGETIFMREWDTKNCGGKQNGIIDIHSWLAFKNETICLLIRHEGIQFGKSHLQDFFL